MRIAFATLGHVESDFYGRVGEHLRRAGHEVFHLTYSRRAAALLRRDGEAHCLPDLMAAVVPERSWADEEKRVLARYGLPDLRAVHRTDPSCRTARRQGECGERTLRHFLAIEALFERVRPDFVVPEVGNETIRAVAHLVGRSLGATTLYLMYTLFDRPLRLYPNTLDAPIVEQSEVRDLSAAEEAELDDFITRFVERDRPIREHRRIGIEARRATILARHLAVRAIWDRDNDYLKPVAWVGRDLAAVARGVAARRLYAAVPRDRPFVYFPLQVADDYKILGLRPHLVDQEAIVSRLVGALPPGVDLVIKEHPMSIGRNSVGMLRRLGGNERVSLVDPHESSLELAGAAAAVATISSTVGMEALLLGKPVLTLGEPFYSGYGVTVDASVLDEVGELLPKALAFEPERRRTRRFLHAAMRHCYAGAPVLVDRSDANAAALAGTLDAAVRGELGPSSRPDGFSEADPKVG